MAQVIWTEQAIQDLEAIAAYIERNSFKYAQITIHKIFSKALLLADFPQMGNRVPEKDDDTIRQLFEGNYRIVYRISSAEIVHILLVFHSARVLK
jgi:toxin ParE1/3/4